jgi:hypothetical protein
MVPNGERVLLRELQEGILNYDVADELLICQEIDVSLLDCTCESARGRLLSIEQDDRTGLIVKLGLPTSFEVGTCISLLPSRLVAICSIRPIHHWLQSITKAYMKVE